MPEGDTVYRTATSLRDALAGKMLTRCDVRVPRYATVVLSGQRVDEVISRGKHLFIRVGAASIHSHLKMDGAWRITARDRIPKPAYKIRIRLETPDVAASGIDLGVLEILDRDNDMDVVAHLGPDLLGEDWNAQTAARNLMAEPDRSIADALLDQRVMAGVGNVYCYELCFLLGRLPTVPVGSLTDPTRIAVRARDMLWANRSRWNRTTTGNTRTGQELWVYGRGGQPCRRCGESIRKADAGPRITYWCPQCQV